jgi:hypothetical protein
MRFYVVSKLLRGKNYFFCFLRGIVCGNGFSKLLGTGYLPKKHFSGRIG